MPNAKKINSREYFLFELKIKKLLPKKKVGKFFSETTKKNINVKSRFAQFCDEETELTGKIIFCIAAAAMP